MDDSYKLAVSDSGYTNGAHKFDWVEHIDKNRAKRLKGRSCLLLDGYRLYRTAPFVTFCWDHNIFPFALHPT